MVRDEKMSEANYKLLAELLLTRTIIFNKRRQAEVQELTVKNLYESLVTDEHQEIVKSLTMPEQILSRRWVFFLISSPTINVILEPQKDHSYCCANSSSSRVLIYKQVNNMDPILDFIVDFLQWGSLHLVLYLRLGRVKLGLISNERYKLQIGANYNMHLQNDSG